MRAIGVLKKGEYTLTENILRPINQDPDEDVIYVCCVCGDTYFDSQGCKDGINQARGIFVDGNFYILVDVFNEGEDHSEFFHLKCSEMFNHNPMAYLV